MAGFPFGCDARICTPLKRVVNDEICSLTLPLRGLDRRSGKTCQLVPSRHRLIPKWEGLLFGQQMRD